MYRKLLKNLASLTLVMGHHFTCSHNSTERHSSANATQAKLVQMTCF